MTPSKQLFRHDVANGQIGDCWRTCIACLLDKSPEEVPHFAATSWDDYEATRRKTLDYLGGLGLSCIEFAMGPASLRQVLLSLKSTNPGHYFILGGNSANNVGHAVICLNDNIVWDPSIDDSGIVGPMDDGYFWVSFLVPLLHVGTASQTSHELL